MRKGSSVLLLAATLVVASIPALAGASVAPSDRASGGAPAKPAVKRGVVLKPSAKEVVEGDRLKLVAKVKSPDSAIEVTLEHMDNFGTPDWQQVKTKKVNARKKVTFRQVATQENAEHYRAIVSYDNGKSAKSKPVNVTVWRWIPLSDYDAYYETSQVDFLNVVINGQSYRGWGPSLSSKIGAWESKFTPGRNCRSLRGVLGLSDTSVDGSTGKIKVTAEDVLVYESPTLAPGMAVPLVLPLANPFRLGLQATNTSLAGLLSWPAIGAPELLCTGV